MKFSPRLRASLALLLGAVGITAGILPDDWIEQRFGFSPDGGNGLVEFLWAAVPLVLAAILALSALRAQHHRPAARL